MNKIIRTICLFTDSPSTSSFERLNELKGKAVSNNFAVQTTRLSSPNINSIFELDKNSGGDVFLNLGSLNLKSSKDVLNKFLNAKNVHFNLDLTNEDISIEHSSIFFEIVSSNPGKTFNFTYTFNNPDSSPYFPSANFGLNGFSIGLQPTDLSENCSTVKEWLEAMRDVWSETITMFSTEDDFLGVDTSIAPLFEGNSSFINFINRLGMNFSNSVTTDTYLQITKFIKEECPKSIGLCGLMFPCLEDFDLAKEYEAGNFTIERNVFLSLHSGLGIDTYPIGVDEKPERVIEILKLLQGLSNKHSKPLSARFVSDGKSKIGDKTDFKNQYLKDVFIRPL